MTSVVDFAHAVVAAMVVLAAPGSMAPVLIDPPALVAATAAHQRPDPQGERWLDQVRRVGPEVGLGDEASRIFVTSSGRAYAPILEERARILALAHDPELRAQIAYRTARADAAELARRLGRPARFADLALVRRLGIDGAVAAIDGSKRRQNSAVASGSPANGRVAPATAVAGWITRVRVARVPATRSRPQ